MRKRGAYYEANYGYRGIRLYGLFDNRLCG
jgi:hypothetical protein